MKRFPPYILSIISGFLFALPWLCNLPGILALVALIPLLYAEHLIASSNDKYIGIRIILSAFLCFFTINILTLWWVGKLLSYWGILYLVLNALAAAGVFFLFSWIKRKTNKHWSYLAFIAFTLTFEYLCYNISFSFPCIFLGVSLAGFENNLFIQWYEYTGVLGGSAWVLSCNVLFFFLLKHWIEEKKIAPKLLSLSLAVALIPICISLFIYYSYEEKNDAMEVVVVQPNIDPYKDKFSLSRNQQLDSMLSLARKEISPATEYILFPETALDSNIWLNNIPDNYLVLKIKDSLLQNYPRAKLVAGVDMMEYYVVKNGIAPTPTARKVSDQIYFDFFNAAILINSEGNISSYKKSKLVLGTEYVPLSNTFAFMQKLSMQLGGSGQSRGRQAKPSTFSSPETNIATIICYESLFGEYVSEFAKLGGEAIFVLTNDGWWDNTPGPRMHFRFSQLRAIENRRAVVRCANTGISGYIDQKGDIIQQSEWWTATAMKNNINKNTQLTFYSQHGDYIGKIAAWVSIVIILSSLFSIFRKNKKGKKSKRSKK